MNTFIKIYYIKLYEIITRKNENYYNFLKYGTQKTCNLGYYRKIRVGDFLNVFYDNR